VNGNNVHNKKVLHLWLLERNYKSQIDKEKILTLKQYFSCKQNIVMVLWVYKKIRNGNEIYTLNELMSVGDVAKHLKVSQQHVRSLIRNGSMTGIRVGKQWVVYEEDLHNYIIENNIVIEPDDHPRQSTIVPDLVALSFFSGAMGLDLGMEQEGIKPLLACEIEKEIRKTIHANKPEIALIGDIRDYNAEKILEYARIPKNHPIDIIYGGPPCQAFSTAGKQKGFEDERGNVFLTFVDLAIELNPTYIVLENVRGLLSAKFPLIENMEPSKGGALFYIINKFKEAGYSLSFELYSAANFGAPQIRERIVIICKKGSQAVDFLSPTNSESGQFDLPKWVTLGEIIKDLDVEHHHLNFPEKRLQYYRMLKEGQNWRNLPDDIQPLAMGKSFSLPGGKTGFYRRLAFNRPAPTLVTHPAMPATDLCHPTENRPLSIEEYKLIQGFPENWIFCGKILDIYKQIGNAVPIPLGKAIAKTIISDMKGEHLPQYKDFTYSRYRNTNHKAFVKQMKDMIHSSHKVR
jgi:DNA (cytosine-5)-methyltransferase 1